MKTICLTEEIAVKHSYDVIVAGGGVAGIAAAVSAGRMGKKVLLIEKGVSLGGLATIGLINLFEPLCNGRGRQILKGLAEEFLLLSIKYGYDTLPDEWKDGEPRDGVLARYMTRFSPAIFSLALTELMENEGIDLLFDTVVTRPIMEGNHCRGLVVENKSGREFYSAKIVVDTTGDADILYRAGVPTVEGKNYFTMLSLGSSLESMKNAVEKQDVAKAIHYYRGGTASLYGTNQPENMPCYEGISVEHVTDYIIKNHLETLKKIKDSDRKSRDIIMLPAMAQFRTTRTLVGDHVFDAADAYKHFDTSIAAICDFDRRDYVYEVPYGTLVKAGYDNLITAGRTASTKTDYSWDVLRVIPSAIATGQAAGVAAVLSIDRGEPIYGINVSTLQCELQKQNVVIHFDDQLNKK